MAKIDTYKKPKKTFDGEILLGRNILQANKMPSFYQNKGGYILTYYSPTRKQYEVDHYTSYNKACRDLTRYIEKKEDYTWLAIEDDITL